MSSDLWRLQFLDVAGEPGWFVYETEREAHEEAARLAPGHKILSIHRMVQACDGDGGLSVEKEDKKGKQEVKPYEPNWPHGYATRDGYPVRLLCTDGAGYALPLVGLVMWEGGAEIVHRWHSDGLALAGHETCGSDLMCVEPKPFAPTDTEMFRFLISNGGGGVYQTGHENPERAYRCKMREPYYFAGYGETPEAAIRAAMLEKKERKV